MLKREAIRAVFYLNNRGAITPARMSLVLNSCDNMSVLHEKHDDTVFYVGAALRAPVSPSTESASDFKAKPSPWVKFEGIRMSLASKTHILQMRDDLERMQAHRMGLAA